MNLSYGSRGDNVRDLQRMLNGKGYQLDEDGIFGTKTQAAVRDYQGKNGLAVDGIVGSKTYGSLKGGTAEISPVRPGTSTQSTRRSGVSDDTYQHQQQYEQGYQPSEAVKQAEEYLQQIQSQKPGEYQSPYAGQLDAMYEEIMGRKPFQYDLNADMLYQQYRDQYKLLGQQAMMDTMGQAAGLTGGYGSSYSQNAGQQAYQGYLQQLNDKVPELYRLALDKYNAEGDEMYKKYGLISDRENDAYGRYRDQVGDWRDDYSMAYSRYGDERSFDYGSWSDMLNYWMQKADNENADWKWQTEFDYQKERDAAEDAYRYAALASRGGSGGSGGSGSGDSGQTVLKPGYRDESGREITENGKYEVPGYGTVNGKQLAQMIERGLVIVDKYGVVHLNTKSGKKPIKDPWDMLQ